MGKLVGVVALCAGCLGGSFYSASAPDMAGPPPGRQDPDPVTPMPDMTCGGVEFALMRVPPNVMLVLDRSGSMGDPIGAGSATSKWDDLKSALQTTVTAYDAQMRFGVALFSDPNGSTCSPGPVEVMAGPSNGAAVLAKVAAASPGGNTPTAATLAQVQATGMLNDTTRENYVVLATDGLPNCTDTDVAGKISALYAATPSVKTFVIGVGDGTASDPATLDSWAVAGHTDRATSPKYFQANSPTDLKTAFDTIAGGLASCTFQMAQPVPDPSMLYVWSNGQPVPSDPQNGYSYDASTQSVTLHGTACDQVRTNPQTKVRVIYGCSAAPIS